MMAKPLPSDSPAIVGELYQVRCVRLKDKGWYGRAWIPVIGPVHEDREIIGFPPHHVHVDVRFLSNAQVRLFCGWARFWSKEQSILVRPVSLEEGGVPLAHEFKVISKRCHRAMPHFPVSKATLWEDKLRDSCRDCVLKDGLVCPHRGFPLAPFAEEHPEGVFAICPGHGLCWNIRERRLATPEEEALVRERAKS